MNEPTSFKELSKTNPNRENRESSPINPNSPTNHLLDKMDNLDYIFNGLNLQDCLNAALDRAKNGLELGIFYHNLELAGIPAKEAEAMIERGKLEGLYYESQPGRLRRLD